MSIAVRTSLFALLLALLAPFASAARETPRIAVDRRVETAAILCRLAGFEEFLGEGIESYDRAIATHFAPYRDHPAVARLRELRESHGIGYGAALELALVADRESFRPRVPLDPLPGFLDARWDPAAAKRFLADLRAFRKAAKVDRFLASQAPLHQAVEQAVAGALEGLGPDLAWFREQYAAGRRATFSIVPGLVNGPNSYGAFVDLPDGTREVVCLLATPRMRGEAPIAYAGEQVLSLVVHEFSHPFVNPWVDARAAVLDPPAEALFAVVTRELTGAAYGRARILLYESLVRAQTIRYLRDRGGRDPAAVVESDRSTGFLWTDLLADELARPPALPFAESGERVAAFFRGWGADAGARVAARRAEIDAEQAARLARGPQVVRLAPADGAEVPAGAATLEIAFDRPMNGKTKVLGDIPELAGRPAWNVDRTVLTIPVTLAPGGSWVLTLDGADGGFASTEGEPLAARRWSFRAK